jgi:hypothetical protein
MWESLRDWAFSELREMSRARTAAVLVAVLGFVGGWIAASRFYAERVAVMQLEIDALGRNLSLVREQPTAISPSTVLVVVVIVESVLLFAVAVSARRNKCLIDRVQPLADSTEAALQVACRERDKAVKDLIAKKTEYANGILERFSRLMFEGDNSMRPADQPAPKVKPTVTIRYLHQGGDEQIVERAKNIFAEKLRWPVTVDANNNPALPTAGQFKVGFDVGNSHLTYGELIHAFSEGNLLGVTVGESHPDRDDTRHLIINVYPSPSA